jgi:hypothetical protein
MELRGEKEKMSKEEDYYKTKEEKQRDDEKKDDLSHRRQYRRSRKDTAVRVFTINDESKYVIARNVHSLGVDKEILELFSSFGEIEE